MANFNYCPIVWHHCGTSDTRKMEKVQERGLRIIYGDHQSSYKELLDKSGLDLLYLSRIKKIALLVYRTLNDNGPALLRDMYSKKENVYTLRDDNKVFQPKVKTTKFGLNSLRYSGSSIWNNMPAHLKRCIDTKHFKSLLKSWDGPACSCGFCVLCTF